MSILAALALFGGEVWEGTVAGRRYLRLALDGATT